MVGEGDEKSFRTNLPDHNDYTVNRNFRIKNKKCKERGKGKWEKPESL